MNDQNALSNEEIAEIAAEMDTMESEIETTDAVTETEESVEESREDQPEETESETAVVEPAKKRGGKPSIYSDKQKVVEHLKIIDAADGEYHYKTGPVSRPLVMQLVDMGLVSTIDKPHEGRGRPMKLYKLTRRGDILIGLADSAAQSQAETDESVEEIASATDEEFSAAIAETE